MKTLIIQSYRTENVPDWIRRCMDSVRLWAQKLGYDYHMADDSSFALCGEAYLAKAGGNIRTITNLSRLELIRIAHGDGYDRAIWLDADIFVFDPTRFRIDLDTGYAVANEAWVGHIEANRWLVHAGINNSVVVCMRGEPDLDFLIQTIRHVAAHRTLTSNYQVGGDLIKGLRKVLDIKTVDSAAMFSSYVVRALARNVSLLVEAQSRYHGTPIYAANLCAADHYDWRAPEADAMTAMDRLEESKGDVVNQWLARGPRLHAPFEPAVHVFKGPDISVLTAPLATVSTPNG